MISILILGFLLGGKETFFIKDWMKFFHELQKSRKIRKTYFLPEHESNQFLIRFWQSEVQRKFNSANGFFPSSQFFSKSIFLPFWEKIWMIFITEIYQSFLKMAISVRFQSVCHFKTDDWGNKILRLAGFEPRNSQAISDCSLHYKLGLTTVRT